MSPVIRASATYAKLADGSWGLRIIGVSVVHPGDVFTATKKDGSMSQETVGSFVFAGNGYFLASLGRNEVSRPSRRRLTKW